MNNTTPRPHPLTFWPGVVALLISLASLIVSWRSRTEATESLRISQQPYLSVRMNVLTVRGMHVIPNRNGVKPADNSPPIIEGNSIDVRQAQGDLAIYSEFEIENSGNTPAFLRELVFTFKVPKGWELVVPWTSEGVRLKAGTNRASITLETLNPKKSISKAISIGLSLSEDARIDFLEKRAEMSDNGAAVAGVRGPVELNAELSFHDEIGEREPLRWCKVAQMNLSTPLDCVPGAVGAFELR